MSSAKTSKKIAAKGDRLNWTPLKSVQPVRLTLNNIRGRLLTDKDLNLFNQNSSSSKNIFVP